MEPASTPAVHPTGRSAQLPGGLCVPAVELSNNEDGHRGKKIIRKLAPVGVWVFLICFGLIAVDQKDNGPLIFYIGLASAALAGIMFWVWKD
jgi:hypothetical protein